MEVTGREEMRRKQARASVIVRHEINPEELAGVGAEVLDRSYYEGMFSGEGEDPSSSFKLMVSRFLYTFPVPGVEFRIKATKILTDDYISQTKEVPGGSQLGLLANWILADQLRDPHPDKVTNTEYPIMNKGQLRTRHRRELVDKYIENRSNIKITKKKRTTEIEPY